jgi:hypothetical protein
MDVFLIQIPIDYFLNWVFMITILIINHPMLFNFCAISPYLLHHYFKFKRYIDNSTFSLYFRRGSMKGLYIYRFCLIVMLSFTLGACGSSDNVNNDAINTSNTAPTADAGTDQAVLLGVTVTLSGAQSNDADNDTLTYLWSITVFPTGSAVALSDVTALNPTFVADTIGTYSFQLVVDDGISSSNIDTLEVNVSAQVSGSTDGILCDYQYSEFNDSASVQLLSRSQWGCVNGNRELSANGVPDHPVGTFPNAGNPNTISALTVSAEYSLTPVQTTTVTTLGGPRGSTGYVLNGVKIDAGTAGSCDNSGANCSLIDHSGSWSIEALGQTNFDFGTDDNNAHVQPTGDYHYHGMPEGFVTSQGGNSSSITIIGWAADGFPIYARYGYSEANNSASSIVAMTGGYQLVTTVST